MDQVEDIQEGHSMTRNRVESVLGFDAFRQHVCQTGKGIGFAHLEAVEG